MFNLLREVTVENGVVRGLPAADPRITSFKGIPFAVPPTGENRWRAPQPAQDWQGVLKAYEFAPISLQVRQELDDNNIYTREWAVEPDIAMSEDCLYLNVWTPAKKADEKLPVYVWYFGGGLQVGHTAEMEFDGERIARRGIIVVTVNYRLNAFGFLCHPEITAESPDAPANFGHLDQQFATRWVHRNIAAFGGDPDNITIGGQSAGGGSVLSQLTSPQNEGFCKRAIIQSGVIRHAYPGSRFPFVSMTLAEGEKEGEKFFDYLGVSSLQEARALDAVYLRDKIVEYKKFWGAVIDDRYCVGNPYDLFAQNKRLMVPVLLGRTSSEFFNTPEVSSVDELKELAYQLFGDEAETFLQLCDIESGDIEHIKQKASISSLEYGIRILCCANSDNGGQTPLYTYNFDAEIPGWDNPGTFHSVDLWFSFETLAKCWRPFTGKHYDLARQMCNYWSHFIKTGDPNGLDSTGEQLPVWKPHTREQINEVILGDTVETTTSSNDLIEFLASQYFKK